MIKKVKFTQRIANAVRALRGDPWPEVLDFPLPKVEVTPLHLETFQVERSVPLEFIDLQGQEVLAETVRRELATSIGKGLMDAGAIEISKRAEFDKGRFYFRAKVRVAMPGEERHG